MAFLLLVAGLATYLFVVGLERADKIASGVGAVLALLALGLPYLLSERKPATTLRVFKTGKATAGRDGLAVSGLLTPADPPDGDVVVNETGDAYATDGGHAVSGLARDQCRTEK